MESCQSCDMHPRFGYRFNPVIVEARKAELGTIILASFMREKKSELVTLTQHAEPICVEPSHSCGVHPRVGFRFNLMVNCGDTSN